MNEEHRTTTETMSTIGSANIGVYDKVKGIYESEHNNDDDVKKNHQGDCNRHQQQRLKNDDNGCKIMKLPGYILNVTQNTTMTDGDDDDDETDHDYVRNDDNDDGIVSLDFSSTSCQDCSQTSLTTGDSIPMGINNKFHSINNMKRTIPTDSQPQTPSQSNVTNAMQSDASTNFSYSESEHPDYSMPFVSVGYAKTIDDRQRKDISSFLSNGNDGNSPENSETGLDESHSSSFFRAETLHTYNKKSFFESSPVTTITNNNLTDGVDRSFKAASGQPTGEDSCSSIDDSSEIDQNNREQQHIQQPKEVQGIEISRNTPSADKHNQISTNGTILRLNESTLSYLVMSSDEEDNSLEDAPDSTEKAKQNLLSTEACQIPASSKVSNITVAENNTTQQQEERIHHTTIEPHIALLNTSGHNHDDRIPMHLRYVNSIQASVKEMIDQEPTSTDVKVSVLTSLGVNNEKENDLSISGTESSCGSDRNSTSSNQLMSTSDHTNTTTTYKSSGTAAFKQQLPPHLTYLADVQKIIKTNSDDIDNVDFTKVHKQIVETQEGDIIVNHGNASSHSLLSNHSKASIFRGSRSARGENSGDDKRVTFSSFDDTDNDDNGHSRRSYRSSCNKEQYQQQHRRLSNSSYTSNLEDDNFSFISESEGCGVDNIQVISNRRRQSNESVRHSDKSYRRSSNQTMTSHLSYSENSDAHQNDSSTNVSGIVSEVMKNIRDEEQDDARSTGSSASFFSARQSILEDRSNSSISGRSQRSYHTCQYGWTPGDFLDEEQQNEEVDSHQEEDDSPVVTTVTGTSFSDYFSQSNLMTVVNFFTETLATVKTLASTVDVQNDIPDAAPKCPTKDETGDQEYSDNDDASIGNVDYGYSDEVNPELMSRDGMDDAEQDDVGSQASDDVSVSAGSVKSGASNGSGTGVDNDDTSTEESSKTAKRMSYCCCSRRLCILVFVFVVLLLSAVGLPVYFLLFAPGQKLSDENKQQRTNEKLSELEQTNQTNTTSMSRLNFTNSSNVDSTVNSSYILPTETRYPSFSPTERPTIRDKNVVPSLTYVYEVSTLSPSIAPPSSTPSTQAKKKSKVLYSGTNT